MHITAETVQVSPIQHTTALLPSAANDTDAAMAGGTLANKATTTTLAFPTDDKLALMLPRRLKLRQTSPIRCPGGKAGQQVLDLSKFVPASFGSLHEPFMGGMNMTLLLVKERRIASHRCHASDTCKELVDFFRTLQDEGARLARALLADASVHGQGSRELFDDALDAIKRARNAYEVARGFYLHNRMAYLALRDFTSPKRYSPARVAKNGIAERFTYRLLLFADILRGVTLAECDYSTALNRAATDETAFVFMDPPYEPVGLPPSYPGHDEALYNAEFDFDQFAHRVRSIENRVKFMITINDSEANRRRFAGLNVMLRDVYYGASNSTKTELVITNYEPNNQAYFARQLGWRIL